jgi:hypothetical protein
MRRAVFSHVNVTAAARLKFSPGFHWGSWRLPVVFEVGLVLALTLVTLGFSMVMLSKQD